MNDMTLDCVRPAQFSVILTIHCNAGLKCFFNFSKMFVIIVIHAYFIYISQGSVEIRLCCGGMYNNFIVANCPQSVSERILKIGH